MGLLDLPRRRARAGLLAEMGGGPSGGLLGDGSSIAPDQSAHPDAAELWKVLKSMPGGMLDSITTEKGWGNFSKRGIKDFESGLSGVGPDGKPLLNIERLSALLPMALEGAPLLAKAPAGALRTFAGRTAKTADHGALAKAVDLEKAGKGADDIWKETGWGRGADGEWRFEIDDSGAGPWLGDNQVRQMPDAMRHDALYEAHPSLKNVQAAESEHAGLSAFYKPDTDFIGVSRSADDGSAFHELQHAVQNREGFARGGSPSEFKQQADAEFARDVRSWMREVDSYKTKMPDADSSAVHNAIVADYQRMGAMDWLPSREVRDYADQPFLREQKSMAEMDELIEMYGLDKATTPRSPDRLYKNLAGEVEARNVQHRMDWTPEQRRETPPWATEDVPRDQQIVRRGLLGDDGPQMSADALPMDEASRMARAEEVASSHETGYNTPMRDPRPFGEDYPQGAPTNDAGFITRDIDGDPITVGPNRVSGRVVEGEDVALSPAQYDAIAEETTGQGFEVAPRSKLSGDAGRVVTTRDRRSNDIIDQQAFVAGDVRGEGLLRVKGHEIGHIVEILAGGKSGKGISTKGLSGELNDIYNGLNNSNRQNGDAAKWAKAERPKDKGYSKEKRPKELWAEAVRAYMENPNYIKTVAPNVAERIRKATKGDPKLSRIIQFNTVAGAGLLGVGSRAAMPSDDERGLLY